VNQKRKEDQKALPEKTRPHSAQADVALDDLDDVGLLLDGLGKVGHEVPS
jgi:hypothetical protein